MGSSRLLVAALLVLSPRSEAFLARGPLPLTAAARPATFRGASTSAHHRYDAKALKMSTAALPGVASAGAVAAAPAAASAPSVKPPPLMYQNAVDIGAKKAAAPVFKTFLMGIISGCHIGFGALLALTIGGNCPGLLATNPGLQKIVFGAFGEHLSTPWTVMLYFGKQNYLVSPVLGPARMMIGGNTCCSFYVCKLRTSMCYGASRGSLHL